MQGVFFVFILGRKRATEALRKFRPKAHKALKILVFLSL